MRSEAKEPINVSYIWIGSPIQKSSDLDIPGHDTQAILLMADKIGRDNQLLFWCLDEHVAYYRSVLPQNVQIRPVMAYLQQSLKNGDLQHAARQTLQIILELLRPERNTKHDKTTTKEILGLFILMTLGDYVVDSNVRPMESHIINLKRFPTFSVPNLDEEIEVWAMFSPPNDNKAAKIAFKYYCDNWQSKQNMFLTSGDTEAYHFNISNLIVNAVNQGLTEGNGAHWKGILTSTGDATIEELGIHKSYFNTHRFNNRNQQNHLSSVIITSDIKRLNELIQLKQDLNQQSLADDSKGETPLHLAIRTRQAQIMEILLANNVRTDLVAHYPLSRNYTALDLIMDMPVSVRKPWLDIYEKYHPPEPEVKLHIKEEKERSTINTPGAIPPLHPIPDVTDTLLVKLNDALNTYKTHPSKENLNTIIDASNKYIESIPLSGREKFHHQSWADVLSDFPYAQHVLDIQKQAVSRLFLPDASTDAKKRFQLFRDIIDSEKKQSYPGKIVKERYWGEFKFKGKTYILDWLNDNTLDNDKKNFLISYGEWLHYTANFSSNPNDANYILDLDTHKVTFTNQLAYLNGELLDAEEELIYAISMDGEIFVAPEKNNEIDFHHSSFLSGKKVLCAGMLSVEEGKIKIISNESGHYTPEQKHLVRALEILEKKYKLDLSQIQVREYKRIRDNIFDKSTQIVNASRYLKMKGFTLADDQKPSTPKPSR